jgi:hypothetical protein
MQSSARRVAIIGTFTVLAFWAVLWLFSSGSSYNPGTVRLYSRTEVKPPSAIRRFYEQKLLPLVYRPRTVNLRAEVFSIPNFNAVIAGKAIGNASMAEWNGAKAWLLSPQTFEKLDASLEDKEIIGRPQVTTGEFSTGAMFIGESIPINGTNRDVGLHLSVTASLRKRHTELQLEFQSSELATNRTVRTNAAFAANVQLPPGKRLFVVAGAKEDASATCFYLSAGN